MSVERPRVLVADDDPAMRTLLRHTIGAANCEVTLVENGATALGAALTERFSMIILDVVMPGLDGLEVCRRVRAVSAVPILLLTGLNDEEHIVRGLDAGADDYLCKPFTGGELLARVRAGLRRARLNAAPPCPPVRTGSLVVDLEQQTATIGGQVIAVTPTERRLLLCLARHAGRIVTTEQLLAQVWGDDTGGDAQLVQVNVSRLRRKIEPNRARPIYIHTLPGVGYSLALLPATPGTPGDHARDGVS